MEQGGLREFAASYDGKIAFSPHDEVYLTANTTAGIHNEVFVVFLYEYIANYKIICFFIKVKDSSLHRHFVSHNADIYGIAIHPEYLPLFH